MRKFELKFILFLEIIGLGFTGILHFILWKANIPFDLFLYPAIAGCIIMVPIFERFVKWTFK